VTDDTPTIVVDIGRVDVMDINAVGRTFDRVATGVFDVDCCAVGNLDTGF
jgi:hypothetical protein